MEIASLTISIIALIISFIGIYYRYFVGPDIKLVFSKKDKNVVFNHLHGGMAEFEGVFINKGNRTGYIHNTNLKRTGLVKDIKNISELIQMVGDKNFFTKKAKKIKIIGVPNFVITIKPKETPLTVTLEPKKIKIPHLLREGDAFPFIIYLHREAASNLISDKKVSQWFKEHPGLSIKVRIYYTTTTKKGLRIKHETLNLKT